MKKLLLLLLALCLILSLAACGQGGGEPEPGGTGGEDPAPQTAQTDDPERMGLADLVGSWELVSGETEGFTFTVDEGGMIAYLEFSEDGTASYREMQMYEPWEIHEGMAVEMQDVPLYDGCGNEAWSAQLITNDPSVEWYVTLLSRDTLRFMQFAYYDEDEYPVVFLGTFQRLETEEERADSLAQLRQQMDRDYLCGVAYLGVCDGAYADGIRGQLRGTGYIEQYPFLADCQWVDWYGYELYCVVPRDPNASVAVNVWDPMTGEDGEVLYRSESGEPIIIQCNGDEGYNPNTHVTIVDSDGAVADFFPMLDAAAGTLDVPDRDDPWMYDFTLEDIRGAHAVTEDELIGDWAAFDLADGNGNARTCGLSFYPDGTVDYWYGEPYSDILERFSGTWELDSGSVILDMTLVGGAVCDDGVEPYDFWGMFDVYARTGDALALTHAGGYPLLYGWDGSSIEFTRSVG